jgi:hypothetical protein
MPESTGKRMDAASFSSPIANPIASPGAVALAGREPTRASDGPRLMHRSRRRYIAACHEPLWWAARRLVADQYLRHFHADLNPAFPRFLGLLDENQIPVAAVGVRFIDEAMPFCQRYVAQPLPELLMQRTGQSVPTARIAELGNLAVAGPRLLAPMFETCANWLLEQDTQWAVFCLTEELRRLLAHAGVELIDLGPARAEAVGEMIARWGSYYAHDPRVMAARVGQIRSVKSPARLRWIEE